MNDKEKELAAQVGKNLLVFVAVKAAIFVGIAYAVRKANR